MGVFLPNSALPSCEHPAPSPSPAPCLSTMAKWGEEWSHTPAPAQGLNSVEGEGPMGGIRELERGQGWGIHSPVEPHGRGESPHLGSFPSNTHCADPSWGAGAREGVHFSPLTTHPPMAEKWGVLRGEAGAADLHSGRGSLCLGDFPRSCCADPGWREAGAREGVCSPPHLPPMPPLVGLGRLPQLCGRWGQGYLTQLEHRSWGRG